MKHRIWLHASVTHSTRWAWPPVHWGDTNTSIQWSCHQVVFACAFGAVSTTQREASCSNMETGASIILISAYPLRTMDLTNNISTGLFEGHLSIMACKSRAICVCIHIYITLLYLCWSVTLLREHNYILGMLECPSPVYGKSQEHVLNTWDTQIYTLNSKSPRHMNHPVENMSNVAKVFEKQSPSRVPKPHKIFENSSRTCWDMLMTVTRTWT